MTVVLAVDTSTSINTIALCRSGNLLAETVVDCRRLHSERLFATVDWVLSEAGLSFQDVQVLAASIGPGSFTGLRIGLAAWKGLALARNLPLVGVSTLDAMTRLGVFQDAIICPVLDARMREVFGAVYRYRLGNREKFGDDQVGPIELLANQVRTIQTDCGLPALFFGDGVELYRDRITAILPEARFGPAWWGTPRAAAVAAEAMDRFAEGISTDASRISPVYLRLSQPEEKRLERLGTTAS